MSSVEEPRNLYAIDFSTALTRLRSSFGWREPPLSRSLCPILMPTLPLSIPLQSLPHSCPSALALILLLPFLSPRSFSHSAFLSFFLSFSCRRRFLPSAPSYPRGNPREPLPFPRRPPSSAPTTTTRVYKLDQPGSTYLPFRIIRLACRPLLHAEFRLIKMILRGLSVVSAAPKTLDLNKSCD